MKNLSDRHISDCPPGLYGATRRAINAAAAFLVAMMAVSAASSAWAEQTILALGDSLVAGYGLAKEDSFPAKLQAALDAEGRDVRVINGGVSGDTSKGGLSRVDWLFADKPDVLLVELGANDGLRGLPPEDTEKNLAEIIERGLATDTTVLLAGMLAPPNLGREYGDAFNAVFPRLAERYEVLFYPFFLDGVAAEPSLNLGDGMHPNPAGVDVIVQRILPVVIEALDAAAGDAAPGA
jgi:acyl-CoA thioesterase-1